MSEWIRYEMTRKERLSDWGGIFRGLFCSLCNSQLVAYLPQQVLAPQDVFVALNVSGTETIPAHAGQPAAGFEFSGRSPHTCAFALYRNVMQGNP
jgi:hypothetical protein